MIKNYFKVAIRYLLRNKGYTAINILGLVAGITSCILIMLFVKSEWSYDRFHSKSGRLYRAWQHEKVEGEDFINTVTSLPMGPGIRANFPEVENECRICTVNPMVKVDQSSFTEDVRMVDSTFFEMFDFKLLKGDPANPFPTTNSVIITQELAEKYFGKKEAIGQNVEMELGSDKVLFTVSGIIKKAPEASSIKYKALIPFANSRYLFRPALFTSWTNVFTETYVLLRDKVKAADLEKKFPSMMKQALGEDYKEGAFTVHLQKISDIHLNTSLPAGNEPISNPKYSYILASIGVLLLLIACINFITLSVGRSTTRALEVGLRKALGAERKQLIRQFWGEAFLVTLISIIIGIVLAAVLVKPFNQIASRELSLQLDVSFWIFCLSLTGLIAILSGIYPAIILSRFNPIEVLKGKLNAKMGGGWLRQSLVIGQFVVSIAMIVSTLTIGKQMNYLKNKDLGYNKEQVVIVQTNKGRKDGIPLAQLYRNELLKHPEVTDVAVSLFSLAEPSWIQMGFKEDNKPYKFFEYNSIDPYFIKTMDLKLTAGRGFDPANGGDLTSSAIVNEAFVKEYGIKDPVGKKLPGKFEQQIIGVVKDFNIQSLHTKVEPLMLTMSIDSVARRVSDISYQFPAQPRISVRMRAGNIAANINLLREAWHSVAPSQEFEYKFLDETVAAQYKTEQRTSSIVKIASALSVFIACIGLFGLATLAVARRTKEIGIRKVSGATVGSIVALISKDFLKLVFIASVLSVPLAWWGMHKWLEDFAYKVNIGWSLFVIAGAAAMVIALLTISFQAIRAGFTNPVKTLRSE